MKRLFIIQASIRINLGFKQILILEEKLNFAPETPIIFTLGLSTHMKGAKEMMAIFSKILQKAPNCVLLIGGSIDPFSKKMITEYTKKLKIPPTNIIKYGFIKNEELKAFYSQSTIVFYTALYESFGLVPIEAMEFGTPVIAFEGGPSETIINGKTGFVIKSGDIEDFAEKFLSLIENESLREAFSKDAIINVQENFTFDQGFERLIKILTQIYNE